MSRTAIASGPTTTYLIGGTMASPNDTRFPLNSRETFPVAWLGEKPPKPHCHMTPEARFHASYVIPQGPGCWIWVRSTNQAYGLIQVDRVIVYAHRYSWELANGPIPDGLVIDHLCRTALCVNPTHMEPVTMRDNTLRGNSPMAKQARRTHCIYGHEFTLENTYVPLNPRFGRRKCRACARRMDKNRPPRPRGGRRQR